jgi:hypothetical protein
LVVHKACLDDLRETFLGDLVTTDVYDSHVFLVRQRLSDCSGKAVPKVIPAQNKLSDSLSVQDTILLVVQNVSLVVDSWLILCFQVVQEFPDCALTFELDPFPFF